MEEPDVKKCREVGASLGLSPELVQAVEKRNGYYRQEFKRKVSPNCWAAQYVLGSAGTGSGRTAAFGFSNFKVNMRSKKSGGKKDTKSPGKGGTSKQLIVVNPNDRSPICVSAKN